MVHDPELAQAGRSAGGKARLGEGPAVLPPEEAGRLWLGSLDAVRRSLQYVAQATACGRLDHRIANTVALAAQVAASTLKIEDDQRERERKRSDAISDDELDAELKQAIGEYIERRASQ